MSTHELEWRMLGDEGDRHACQSSPAWLTPAKLTALGFDLPDDRDPRAEDRYARTLLPKEVYIVLEQDGPLYREALERTAAALATARELSRAHPENDELRKAFDNARERLQREQISASRLFAVDAGRNPEKLRETYRDRSRYIIVKGLVRVWYPYRDGHRQVRGTISRLVIERIHVPLAQRQSLDPLLSAKPSPRIQPAPPRYEITLAYGRRLEPWIVAVKPAPGRQSPDGS